MLEEILNDDVDKVPSTSSSPMFSTEIDYGEEIKKREDANKQWASLGKAGEQPYKSIEEFHKSLNIIDTKDAANQPAKNYYILKKEAKAQLERDGVFRHLPIDPLYLDSQLMELLEHIENVAHIRELYKLRKKTVGTTKNAGISAEEAGKLKNCMRQGRELYIAGKHGSLMVKPLNLFYALTAYAYAIIVLNNPLRYTLDALPGAHGVNFLPKLIQTQFGGGLSQGTFSDLFCSFPTVTLKEGTGIFTQDCTDSVLAFHQNRFTTSMGTLLSMIPEIRDYYKLVTEKVGRTHPLERTSKAESRSVKWIFRIGDGVTKPSIDDVNQAFKGCEITESNGQFVVTASSAQLNEIKACIYSDVRGALWYIENPFFPVIVPEICVHFLLSNSFSNVMRYSPSRWGDVLLNEANSEVSLIARKYLSAFESKFPFLILRSISKFYPFVE